MNTQEYNQEVSGWTAGSVREMKRSIIQLTLKHSGRSRNELKGSTKKYHGEANKIGFTFPVYMVYVHKGAGRGYGGFKTGKFTNASGGKSKTNPASFGKMGKGLRRAKPWFNPVVEKRFAELGDIITRYKGEKIVLNLQRILID